MDVDKEILNLDRWLKQKSYKYYSINTIPKVPFITSLANNNRIVGVIWRQLFRLSPINFRPILNKGSSEKNPKAMILLALSYLELWYFSKNENIKKQFIFYINKVINIGLHNNYFVIPQLKKLYLKSYQADENDISPLLTALAGFLFIKAYKYLGDDRYLKLADNIGKYFIEKHPRIENEEEVYFYYAPNLSDKIYNASAVISSFLIELSKVTENSLYKEFGKKGIDYIIRVQNPDGSWFYGENKYSQYIDNFHTAFILLSLYKCKQYINYKNILKSFNSGLEFYIESLFKNQSKNKIRPIHFYYKYLPHNSNIIQKVDIRDCALSIMLFSFLSKENKKYLEYSKAIYNWTIKNMKSKETFYTEITWFWKNKIPYIELQAWMLISLTTYYILLNNNKKGKNKYEFA